MKKNLFLISSSYYNNGTYLGHCSAALKEFLGLPEPEKPILLIPYAGDEWENYSEKMRTLFSELGYQSESAHNFSAPELRDRIKKGKYGAVFIGGGNTYLLKKAMENDILMEVIRYVVETGLMKYIGSSAGSVIACPSIRTTNDKMNVIPKSFDGLNLTGFQINPHFISGNPVPGHMQETRDQQLVSYLKHNSYPNSIVGLSESNWLVVEDTHTTLYGENPAHVFKNDGPVALWKSEGNVILEN